MSNALGEKARCRHMSFWPWACAALLILGASGCGSPEPEPGREAPTDTSTEAGGVLAVRQFIRVDVRGSGSALELLGVSPVDLGESAASIVPSLGGELMAVSYAAGEIQQAMPFSLPREVILEGFREGGGLGGTRAEIASGEASLFLAAETALERVEILGPSGAVLLSLDAEQLSGSAAAGEKRRLQASEAALLRARFPHIHFLDPGAGDALPAGLPDVFAGLVPLSEAAAAALERALDRLPPVVLGSVRSIGIASVHPGGTVRAVARGSALFIGQDVERESEHFEHILAHEAIHCYQHLVGPDLNAEWPDELRRAAGKLLEQLEFAVGVVDIWTDLHQSGVRLSLAQPYLGEAWKDLPVNGDLTTQGFATDYGASYPGEDMAEYASALLVPEDFGEIPPCARIRNAPTPFPAELAIAFAKIKFVQSLGLVPDRSIDGCVGNPSLEGPEGLHLGDALSLEANLKGGWLDADGAHFLAVAADAGPYRSLLRVKAPNDHALGMHRLASIAFPTLNMPNNALYLSHDDYDRTRASSGGLVLVTSASPWRVEGAIFFLTLQNARGMITDEFPISTFRVSTP